MFFVDLLTHPRPLFLEGRIVKSPLSRGESGECNNKSLGFCLLEPNLIYREVDTCTWDGMGWDGMGWDGMGK